MSLSAEEVDFGEQNIIYITEQNSSDWTNVATEELLKLYDKQIDLFEKGAIKTKKQLFEIIAGKMAQKEFYYNSAQCENKWKSLKRAFLTRLEKNPVLLKTRPRPFESMVSDILKKEKPSYKRNSEINYQDQTLLNLNHLNRLTKEETHSEDNDEELSHILLDEDTEQENDIPTKEEPAEHSYSYQYTRNFPNTRIIRSGVPQNDSIKEHELTDLKQSMKRHYDATVSLMKNTCKTQENIERHLRKIEKNSEEVLQIKRLKLEKQSELIQQIKIQNSLLAKIVQKMS